MLNVYDTVVFAMLGTVMFCSKIALEGLPNIHLLGMFTMVFTVVFHKKALFPIYVYIFLNGLYSGFAMWWIPHLYIWTVLWAVTMMLPKKLSKKVAFIVYPIVCSLHGFCFGILYAPMQALMYNLSFKAMLNWIAAGFPWDIVHGIGNFAAGFLVVPLSELIKKLYAGR